MQSSRELAILIVTTNLVELMYDYEYTYNLEEDYDYQLDLDEEYPRNNLDLVELAYAHYA